MARRPTQAEQWEALLSRYDAEIRDAFLEAIADMTDTVRIEDVASALERGDLAAAIDAMQLEGTAFRKLDEAVRQAYITGAVDAAAAIVGPPGGRLVIRFDTRNLRAEAWLRDHSSNLVTRIIAEQRDSVRAALVSGMERGLNPMQTALDIVGRINRGTGRRAGGVIGLSAPQERTMAWVRAGFRASDPDAMRRYLGLARRDRRYDRIIGEAIRSGKLAAADAKRISDRLADRYLKLRGDVIGRTESLASLNAGRTEAFAQAAEKAGIEQEHITRAWSATMDKNTRDSHMAMHQQTVKGLTAPFVSPTTGARLMFPGDTSLGAPGEETIQCRCRVDLKVDWFRGRG